MKLYHGSSTTGITELIPQTSNHEKPLVYLTDSRPLAVIYASNYLTRPLGFFTYVFGSDGKLHYEEYFGGQTELFYKGKKGIVYTVQSENLPRLPKMPWVYTSEQPVKPDSFEEIPDIYEELKRLDREGELILHYYEDLSQKVKEQSERIIVREIENLKTDPSPEYEAFLREHFPHLFK